MRLKAGLLIVGAIASFFSLTTTAIAANLVEVTHRLGVTTVESEPERVVVIGLGALDALDSFGIDPVAISKAATLPGYLSKYKSDQYVSSGSLFEPDFEAIFTQKPDVILVGARGASSYEELSKIAPTIVFATEADQGYWKSTQQQWRNLGKVFNISDKVEQKIDALDQQFNAIRNHNQDNSVDALTVMSSGGNITTFGENSRFSAIYKDFGFNETVQGIKQTRHGDLISYEFIGKTNPSTLLIIDKDKLVNKGKSNTQAEFENELVQATNAYKNGHMTYLDINAWYLSIAGVTATEQMVVDVKNSIGLN
ncbi:siderophore ABC transporter substrate-binding protein [Vibrio sp. ZSDE26]|uniref:Siderophore ABC transporter substrate-binding protein n=1 Tax=Vibrio amylolyticus TaxID=2847292 RepID=A0A9X1XRB7_9VIBR|nr:siderophore ABC transporter substrate-binding protein [Vibrio amylolyticus]MCK6265858.1 siderophore ABC transporter substrate-binding protein [Vibrio amylolyticus]